MSSQSINLNELAKIRADFPTLSRETKPGTRLVYLDSAATAQKPKQVLAAVNAFYEQENANIHRGIHQLAEEATASYEHARNRIADFIGTGKSHQLIFTRNATESINLVAQSWGRANLSPGDRILLTVMEHHSNIVPWQMLAAEKDLHIDYVPITQDGRLDLDQYASLLEHEPRIVAFTHVSNMLGTINPVDQMTTMAHQSGAIVVVDGAQAVPHLPVCIDALDVDFYAFSGHKMCGPTGIGVLYGREALLEAMPPFLGGGDMIRRVTLEGFATNDLPYKFEAGTPAIAQAIGLGAAVDYLKAIGMEKIHAHERELTALALERLAPIPGLTILGPDLVHRGGVIAFVFEDIHPHDVAQILDMHGIAVRAGHHCAMPLHDALGLPATTRASFYLYNDESDLDALVQGLYDVVRVFG
ncbi:MAG: cysteine desulfurase [Anaerolineales bacterium]|nr:cysteine desulfurase [Anaerolineales bacterium]